MTQGYIIKSFDAQKDDIEKINSFTRTPFEADRLYTFTVALCNNDIDRDYERFSVDALNQLADAFVGKTGIRDHSMSSCDQMARIYDTYVEKLDDRKTSDNQDFYQLKAKAYMLRNDANEQMIEEIEAGIKKEVSISCMAKKSVCSICGADIKQKRCEHIAGKSYSGKLAFRTLCDIGDAYEFSFVAVPAQREAGVTKAFDLSEGDFDLTELINELKSCDSELAISKAKAKELGSYISSLEEEAELGRSYKKSLAEEVVGLCAAAMPDMDIKVFSGVAQVMTAKELLSFKTAFTKAKNKAPSLQLCKSNSDARVSLEEFKM